MGETGLAIMDFLRCQNKLRAQMQTQGNMTAIRNLARAFRSMDESQKGVLTKEQFERALGYCHMFLNNQEVETIMSHYDLKHDGTMVYEKDNEFVDMVTFCFNHQEG